MSRGIFADRNNVHAVSGFGPLNWILEMVPREMNSIVHPFLGQSVEVFKLSPGQNLGGPGLILDQNQLISVTKYKINTIISQVTVDFKHLKAFKRRNYPLGCMCRVIPRLFLAGYFKVYSQKSLIVRTCFFLNKLWITPVMMNQLLLIESFYLFLAFLTVYACR